MINALINYGIKNNLINPLDEIYLKNGLLEILGEDSEENLPKAPEGDLPLQDILKYYTDRAIEKGVIDDIAAEKILYETKIMGVICPKPSEIIEKFHNDYKESPKKATDNFFAYSKASNYIRTYDVAKDIKWKHSCEYGDIDITINLSKPEKDPRMIAKMAVSNGKIKYPQCALCRENEGYAGRMDHPARQNLRMIPMEMNGAIWYLQYSPYVYYNEHCIFLRKEHIPMNIARYTFDNLLTFAERFPHYFMGSNAGLPIVGGSILAHEHYQGGSYTFAMEKAPAEYEFKVKGFEDIHCCIVKWPMSVIRVTGENKERVLDLSEYILNKWYVYSDEEAEIICKTDVQHNTVTPIGRMSDGKYQMDLVLRNNRTTEQYPYGIFAAHEEYHNIKKENIGLIEVMGLAVLPSRLKVQLEMVEKALLSGEEITPESDIYIHKDMVDRLRKRYGKFNEENVSDIVRKETGDVFVKVLENAGVYKRNEEGQKHFRKFIDTL